MATGDHIEQRYRLLFERHWRRVLAYVLRRSANPAAADDVVADVFLTAWRRIGDIPADNELAWLLAVARRALSNTRRGDARRDRLLERLHRSVPSVQTDGAEAVDESEAVEGLQEALSRLRTVDVEILQLSTWEQLTHAQIAVVFDCSINAVTVRLHRARQRLAEELAKEWDPTGHTTPKAQSHRQRDPQP